MFKSTLWDRTVYHAHTAVLFTISDLKTIFIPIVSLSLRFIQACLPTGRWFHVSLCSHARPLH